MKAKEFFDPEYQTALFKEGVAIGRAGGPWMKQPVPKTQSAGR